jgi:hypothetical protein
MSMQSDKGDLVLILTVVLEHTQQVIEVRERDHPTTLAEEFCRAHGLEASVVPSMTRYIEQQLKANEETKATGLHIKLKSALGQHAGERLYKKAVEKLVKHKSVSQLTQLPKDEDCTFKPSINKDYRPHSPKKTGRSQLTSSPKLSSSSSYQRLYEEAKDRRLRVKKALEERLPSSIEASPLRSRSKSQKVIDQLTPEKAVLKGSLEASPTSPQLARARTPIPDDESRVKRRYQSIFEHLKPTRKGTLTCATIARCDLTDEQAVFLRPILEKLVTSDLEMGFEEFCTDVAYLQQAKQVKDLTKLFDKSRGSTPTPSVSRTRVCDPSTLKFKPDEATEFYSRQVTQQQIKQQYLKSVRRRLEDRELEECTFKPKIKKVYSST